MSTPSTHNAHELHQAFVSFNALSQQLIDSYHTLERRVSQLALKPDTSPPRAPLRAVLNALPAGVIVLDGAGVITEHNPAALELLGEPLLEQRWVDVIARAFAPRPDDGHDVSILDGRRVHLATMPLGDEPGQVISLTDVTQTRALQDRLHQVERLSALGEMAAGLAHQLRTPLSTAVLYLGLLKRIPLSDTERLPLVEKTLARMRHLEALVRDMLLLVRADQDGGEPLTASDLLRTVEQYARPHIPTPRIMFSLIDNAGDAIVRAQRDVLVSAIQNLINNAVQSIAEAGCVTITAECTDPGWLDVQVRDTGCGIAAQDQAHIGELFFTTRDSGTGLGLAVVNAVVKAHQGSLSFSSIEGQGSTFTLRLPVIVPAQQMRSA